jgi:multidrug efflux pump subunit AcrB
MPAQSHRRIDRLHARHERFITRLLALRWIVLGAYTIVTLTAVAGLVRFLGTDMFPAVDTGQFQLRLRAPTGTRVERTEDLALKALGAIDAEAGTGNVATTLAFVGTVPSTYPINSIYLWSSGSHEALLTVALKRAAGIRVASFQERLRHRLAEELPEATISFEAADVVSQIMNFGAPTPIQVTVTGANLAADRSFANNAIAEMRKIGSLRDLQFAQAFDYPTVDIQIDRERAGQLGVTMDQIGRSLAVATSSSRYVTPNYWRDPANGIAYQVQVEIPQSRIASLQDVSNVPAMPAGASRPLVGDVAQIGLGTTVGEYDRYNQQRMVTITANTSGGDLGRTAQQVRSAIGRIGDPPRGVSVNVRGQVAPMDETLAGLRTGLGVAIVVIFLLMAANFQSLRLALVVLSTVPAVLLGVVIALLLTGTTLNVQSFMGAIMAIGILVVTFAERDRRGGADAEAAALSGARSRMRPVLMTSLAMIAGMVPMALALGQGGEQTAPLGRAVIGGLMASTLVVLIVLPVMFSISQRGVTRSSGSWHPDDAAAAGA